MAKQAVSPVERHLEKGVLGLALLVLAGVVVKFLITSPNNIVDLAGRTGPWQAIGRALRRPGRNRIPVLPIVTNGMAQVMVDTMEHARDLAGLLNWCGIRDLDPVADLVPPATVQ